MSIRLTEPLLRRKDDLYVAYLNVRTLQDVGVQALTMRKPRKYYVDIACLAVVRISDSGHSVIKVPGEEDGNLYHSEMIDNTKVINKNEIYLDGSLLLSG